MMLLKSLLTLFHMMPLTFSRSHYCFYFNEKLKLGKVSNLCQDEKPQIHVQYNISHSNQNNMFKWNVWKGGLGKFTKTKLASDLNWFRGLEIIKVRAIDKIQSLWINSRIQDMMRRGKRDKYRAFMSGNHVSESISSYNTIYS